MNSSRVVGIAAAVLVAVVVATAVVLATRTTATQRPAVGTLTVGPGPLRTATGVLTYHDASGVAGTATLTVDFVHGRAAIVANAAVSIATIQLEARLVGSSLYLNDGTLSSLIGAPWVVLRAPRAPALLDRLASTLRHPDFSARARRTVTSPPHGSTSTTTYWLGSVDVPFAAGLPVSLPRSGTLVLSVTTGRQGQALAIVATLRGATASTTTRFDVTSYNAPVRVAVPPRTETVPMTTARARQLFGTNTDAMLRLLRTAGVSVPG